jgi:hypothetical protein
MHAPVTVAASSDSRKAVTAAICGALTQRDASASSMSVRLAGGVQDAGQHGVVAHARVLKLFHQGFGQARHARLMSD